MESDRTPRPGDAEPVHIRMLGPLEISRRGAALLLPASRKVQALVGYLALSPRGVPRTQLCSLLWDVPNDPRAELRWCLSKIRRLIDDPDRPRVWTRGDAVGLDTSRCHIDAVEVQRGMTAGAGALNTTEAESLVDLFAGDLLEGLETENLPAFTGWLASQRRRFRMWHVALLERIATQVAAPASIAYLERWLELAPFDGRAHELFLVALADGGRIEEAEEHLRVTARRFEDKQIDFERVRRAWDAARRRAAETFVVSTGSRDAIATPGESRDLVADSITRRASVAVMPFHAAEGDGSSCEWANALARDVITRLAKLRSLFVIAEGTVVALAERRLAADAGRLIGVDYLVTGALLLRRDQLSVEMELDEMRSSHVVWSERFDVLREDAFELIDDIGDRVVASIASEIEANERKRSLLKPPSSLDAWEAYHRGLWHMYRFTRADNAAAHRFFERAVALDPTFSRAYAGLSFTHWQDAFQGWADREVEMDRALDAARRGMLVDDRDPAVHWALGRALWLRGLYDHALTELLQAVDLSPNFAQGHYTLAFVQAQNGDPSSAIAAADRSRHLSPFDPLLFGMLGARAIALVRLGRFPEAADDAVKAAARPNAHAHIYGIAAFALALAGAPDEARAHAEAAVNMSPGYSLTKFIRAFRLDGEGEARFAEGARRIGFA